MKKLRVIKVLIQPVLVVDDEDTGELTEAEVAPIAVVFRDWEKFADGGLHAALDQLEASFNGEVSKA